MAPFTVMPIQMFNWTSRPDAAFHANAAAAGTILVVMTLLMNGLAIWLRYQAPQEHQMVTTMEAHAHSPSTRHAGARNARCHVDAHADEPPPLKAESRNLSFYYGRFKALKNVSMPVHERKVTALIGPSGCGKSTFLRCFNRMHDLYPGNRYDGEIILHPDKTNLLATDVDPIEVRMRSRHGVPEAESVPEVDLRERGLRPAAFAACRRSAQLDEQGRGVADAAPRCGTR